MPFRKKTFRRKKKYPIRRKRKFRKRVPRALRSDYNVKLNALTYQIANNSTVPVKGGMDFSLDQCLAYTNYTKLFDQYRINMVVVKFTPVLTQVVNRPYDDTTTPGALASIPRIVTALDRDDSSVPIDFDTVQKKARSRIYHCTKPILYKFRPSRLAMMYRTSSTTGYKVDTQFKEFLDCGQADIPHYGLKYVMDPASPSNAFTYDIEVFYYVSFKNKRG